jgi:hypothetical protein
LSFFGQNEMPSLPAHSPLPLLTEATLLLLLLHQLQQEGQPYPGNAWSQPTQLSYLHCYSVARPTGTPSSPGGSRLLPHLRCVCILRQA